MDIESGVQQMINSAWQQASREHHEFLTAEHILYSALFFSDSMDILEEARCRIPALKQSLEEYFTKHLDRVKDEPPQQTIGFQSVIERALIHTQSAGKPEMTVGDILVSLYESEQSFAAFMMNQAGVTRLSLLEAVADYDRAMVEEEEDFEEGEETEIGADGVSEGREKSGKSGVLEKFLINLTEAAAEGELEPLIGREEILERTVQVLSRRLKNNPIHVGEPGVGKTAITHGLAQRIALGEVAEPLQGYTIYSLEMGTLLAGTRFRGDFEERVKQILAALRKKEKTILFIDEIHTLIGAGAVSGGTVDAANLLKPALSDGRLRCIGCTTFDEYKKIFEKDRALSRRFQMIEIPEPDDGETRRILEGLVPRFEEFHGLSYEEEAVEAARTLSDTYLDDRRQPDKAIDLIDEAGAWVRLYSPEKTVRRRDVERVVARMARVPEKTVSASEEETLKDLETDLGRHIFGQDRAVRLTASAIKRSRAGFRKGEKPVASMLFVGPTGVGKTALARQLSESMGIPLIRFDMSEYQEKHTVSRLIGSPPGYVGFEEGGLLTDAVRKKPHAVLLLDEIEKAHTDIFNILLQVMDYATLTDNTGKKADFRNIILIMTSNAGAENILRPLIGFSEISQADSAVDEAVRSLFSPEFRNRLDKIVPFSHLEMTEIRRIVRAELDDFRVQLRTRGVELELSDDCIEALGREGYSPEFGARNIGRIFEERVKEFFIDEVLFGRLRSGGRVHGELKDGLLELVIEETLS